MLVDQAQYKRSKALRNLKGKDSRYSRSLSRKSVTRRHSQIRMLTPEIKEQLRQLRKKHEKQLSEEGSPLLCKSYQDPKMSRQSFSNFQKDVKNGEQELAPKDNSVRKKPTFRNSTGHGEWNFNTIKEIPSPVKSVAHSDSMHTSFNTKAMAKQKAKNKNAKLKKVVSKQAQIKEKEKDAEKKIADFLEKIEAKQKKPPILGYKVKKHTRNNIIFKGNSTGILKKQSGSNGEANFAQTGLREKMREFKKLSNLSPPPYRLNNVPKAKAAGSGDMNPKTLKEVLFTIKNDIEKKIHDIQAKEAEKPLLGTEKIFKNEGKYRMKSFSPTRKNFGKKGWGTSRNVDKKKINFVISTLSPKKPSLSHMKKSKTFLDRSKKSLKPEVKDDSMVLPEIQSPRSVHS